jgi:MFS family permease
MSAPSVPASQAQPNSISPWPVFWIASVAVFLVSIDVTVLYAAFPALRRAFPGADSGGLSWVLNAYTLVFAALLVPAGRLADCAGASGCSCSGSRCSSADRSAAGSPRASRCCG